MRAVVLDWFAGSNYADTPDAYEFPRRYLHEFDPLARGEPMVAIIYEPRGESNDGRVAYVGWALLLEPPVLSGGESARGEAFYRLTYADRYREFDRIVPREATGEPVETWLRAIPRGRERNVATYGRAVRPLMVQDMELIFSLGFPNGVDRALLAVEASHEFAEGVPTGERTRRLVSAVQREASFRDNVLAAYSHRCAISGLSVGPSPTRAYGLLDAAHIRPVASRGVDAVGNGLALTPTLHRLFDKGLFTIDYRGSNLEVRVSPRLDNTMIRGREGFELRLADRHRLSLPTDPALRPAREQLAFHHTLFVRH